jgi:hypothetical protein
LIVRIERLGGPNRLAYLPAEKEPVRFGVHEKCPVYRSVAKAIEITTEYRLSS